jgi:glycosyltransferase involved in cell wall biosynthesis
VTNALATRTSPREGEPGVPAVEREIVGIASFPSVLSTNPYQRLLYAELARHGFEVAPDAPFDLGWLRRSRGSVRILHFHWPQSYWRNERGPRPLRRLLAYPKLALFALRLAAARRLGYLVVWTVHQVYPHERVGGPVDRLGARILARAADLLLVHDRGTADTVAAELPDRAEKVAIVPHGPYTGVYPPGRNRETVRRELGLSDDTFAFLCFGDLRTYKGVAFALEAFEAADAPHAALVVTGGIEDGAQAGAVRAAAAADPRILDRLGFVPDEGVAELFSACDAALLSRTDGGTSGSLILALSLGLPVVAARRPAYEELLDGDAAGWLFEPGDRGSLAATLARAASTDPDVLASKRAAASAQAARLRWDEIGARTAALMRKALA